MKADENQKPQVLNSINGLLQATGLTDNEAKTVVYWAIATHGLNVFDCFPLLLVHGQPATGKSTILKLIGQLTNAKFISTTTSAEFRDLLRRHPVVIIEEADHVNEGLLLNRYSRQTAQVDIKQPTGRGDFISESWKYFGATGMHRRYPLEDLALQSRTITIHTKKKDRTFNALSIGDMKAECRKLWDQAWENRIDYNPLSRTAINWRPLVIIAMHLEDYEFMAYAAQQQQLAEKLLNEDGEFEPEQMLTDTLYDLTHELSKKNVYLIDIVNHLNEIYRWKTTPKRVAKLLRSMGYVIKRRKDGHIVELP